ncbi:MAG: response regulator [Candidatus Caenarcaniphilales bacterium]|nr:response regulator [Candidatus Caenarcaniphilales bacterium]
MGEKLSVLIADDEDSLRTLVRAVLEADEQYIIDEASDGDEVLTKVHNDKPDILILDIMMPGHSGFEICERIKQDPELKAIKVIILTAKGQASEEKWAQSVGADFFMAKPFSPLELLETVKKITARVS